MFERICDPAIIAQAWEKVRANAGGPGGDGVTIEAFARRAAERLARLARNLAAGTYRPGPVRQFDIAKREGGRRRLAVPCVVDRIAQTAAALVLGPRLDAEMEDSSFAYRPGRSVRMAVDRIAALRRQGYGWVVEGDIERFFDSVPHERLLARLARSVYDARVQDLIALWLESFAPGGLGLPQGGPISPLLANLYLDEVDERIESAGVRLIRFADDFVLLCRDRVAAGAARERMRALLAEQGLRLHPEKTRIVPFEQGFRFLGHLFVRSLAMEERDAGAAPESAAVRGPASEKADHSEKRQVAPEPAAPSRAAPTPRAPARLQQGAEEPAMQPPAATAIDDLPAADGVPALRVLYVMEPGRRVDLRNESIIVVEGEDELLALPPRRVDRIELGGGAAISEQALRHAMLNDVSVSWLDGHGREIGRADPPAADRAALHLAQASHALDPVKRLDLARRLVAGRLRNQRALLRRLNRRRDVAAIDQSAEAIGRALERLRGADSVAEAMGCEGEAGARYWPALGAALEHGWRFVKRERRPPPDPVNLVLSWLSSLLTRDVRALAIRRGLHPGFGALHAARDGGDAAAYDLVEEFRAPLAEGLAVYLFNNRILGRDMFVSDGQGCRILPEGRRAAIRGYEAWLDRPVMSPRSRRKIAWRRLIGEQVVAYAQHMRGEAPYEPYRLDH